MEEFEMKAKAFSHNTENAQIDMNHVQMRTAQEVKNDNTTMS
jgi:hypothetical protein